MVASIRLFQIQPLGRAVRSKYSTSSAFQFAVVKPHYVRTRSAWSLHETISGNYSGSIRQFNTKITEQKTTGSAPMLYNIMDDTLQLCVRSPAKSTLSVIDIGLDSTVHDLIQKVKQEELISNSSSSSSSSSSTMSSSIGANTKQSKDGKESHEQGSGSIDVSDINKNTIAGCTKLRQLIALPWMLSVGKLHLLAVPAFSEESKVFPTTYEQILTRVLSRMRRRIEVLAPSTRSIPYAQLCDLIRDAILQERDEMDNLIIGTKQAKEERTALHNLISDVDVVKYRLQSEGLIVHHRGDGSPSEEETVYLKPEINQNDLLDSLDVEGHHIHARLTETENKLAILRDEIHTRTELSVEIMHKAQRQVRLGAWGAGGFMIAQWAYIFAMVYEISWDFMEPVCYFLGSGYGILAYIFFMYTQREPEAGNIWQQCVALRRQSLHKKLSNEAWRDVKNFDAALAHLHREAAATHRKVTLLSRRIGLEEQVEATTRPVMDQIARDNKEHEEEVTEKTGSEPESNTSSSEKSDKKENSTSK